MLLSTLDLTIISLLFFLVAALYSSVGHGGASGYLAILSLFSFAPQMMATTALILNLVVAGIAMTAYWRSGHLSFRFVWPFVVLSIPAAFIGGMLRVPASTYSLLLGFVLLVAAIRLSFSPARATITSGNGIVRIAVCILVGGGIGFLSGLVGVGGGIFLSPLLLLLNWADVKRTAATSAFFILVNSMSALTGKYLQGGFAVGLLTPFMFSALAGGIVGSYAGVKLMPTITLRRLLAIVLTIAAVKLLITS